MMNPLSPFTYYRRHKRRALLLIILVSVTTLGICITARAFDFLAEQSEIAGRYLAAFSTVSAIGPSLEPGVVSRIWAQPDVAWVIPEKALYLYTPFNTSGGFRLFGVREDAMPVLMHVCSLRLKKGRLPEARRNEIVLSEELADSLGLQVGDQIGRSINEEYYEAIPTTMVLVGILKHDASASSEPNILTGFVPYEYLDSHELYASRPSGLLVIAQEGRKAEVDRFLETAISALHTDVWTLRRSSEEMARVMFFFHLLFGIADCLIAVVIALVVGTIIQIGLTQRIADLGLLHAIGHSRNRLTGRLVQETAGVAGVGWLAGLVLSWLLFALVKTVICPPSMEVNLANLTPIWLSAPIPLTVIAFAALSTMRTFARFDAVSIIERGRLGAEATGSRRAVGRSSAMPLSPWTFYRRHRRQGSMLIIAVVLMILGVVFPVFLWAPQIDVLRLRLGYLRYVSVISPRTGASVDPGVTAQVRTHPAVAQAIPTVELGLLIETPPLSRNRVWIYGVSEDDMLALIDLYGMQVEEGRLPRPRANEIAVSRAIAVNRGLHVGDSVGRPIYEDDRSIPTEMVVAGILSRPLASSPPATLGTDRAAPLQTARESEIWLGFASYEYLRSHELYTSRPVSLLVIPAVGRKSELDAWLEEEVASEQTAVSTYAVSLKHHRQTSQVMLAILAAVESVMIVVAPIALAILSHTFFLQRQEEFGILHAMGHSRRWLVLRTGAETAAAVGVAWLIAAAVCGAGLIYMRTAVYMPKGLPLNLLNPTPWLFTIPLPAAVVAASTGLVARMLRRLDPVSMIERR